MGSMFMNKDYYKDYYQMERQHWWFVIRAKIILERIQKLSNPNGSLKILNVGVATGRSTELLEKFGEVTSLEYDQDCCEFLRQELHIPVIQGSVLDLPFESGSFDLVCAFDVIEHVEDDQQAVKELKRVCKDQGLVVVTVPAFMQLWSHHDVVNQHYRRYVLKQLKQLFDDKTHKTIYYSYFNTFLFIPIWFFRQLSRILPQKWARKESGSDFSVINSKSFLNKIFYTIFNTECIWLRYGRFPFGVSIILAWQKSKI